MKYALLIHLPAGVAAGLTEADEQSVQDRCHALTEDVRGQKRYGGSVRLAPENQAVSLRLRGTTPVVTDGPFAETKEYLAGIYLVDCDTVEQALAYAQRHPGVAYGGTIEVRPVAGVEAA